MGREFLSDVISVIIPCYNCEKTLPKCLDAILDQTYDLSKVQLILVNDGSGDSTDDIIERYEKSFLDKKVSYCRTYQENQGVGTAVNNALKYVSGEFLIWQDPDDYFEKDALLKLHAYLKEHENIVLVRGEVYFRNLNDPDEILKIGRSDTDVPKDIAEDLILRKNMYCLAGCFMGRSSVFNSYNNGMDIYPSRTGQNFQLLLPFVAAGPCGYLPEVVYNCFISSNSLSHKKRSVAEDIRHKQQYLYILHHTMNKINLPNEKKKKLLSLANKKFQKKIFSRKLKLVFLWLFGCEKNISFKELCGIIASK